MTGSVEKQLNSYIQQLNAVQKKSLLGFIKTIFPAKDEEETISIEQYNKELEEADAAIDRGEYYTNEEVFEISKKMIDARRNG
jgi:hypothetical protein